MLLTTPLGVFIGLTRFCVYITYRIIRAIFHILHDKLRPVTRNNDQVQILKIVARGRASDIDIARDCDFLLVHQEYASSDLLLCDPHWNLYTFSRELAYFVRTREPLSQYDVVRVPFLYNKQFH